MLRIIDWLKRSNITKKVPIWLKLKINYFFSKKTISYPLIWNNKLKIVVALAADYGNLGDIAITLAQIIFLSEFFPDYEIVIVTVNNLYMLPALKTSINRKDIITIIGGGNMGDVYEGLEKRRRYIINLFPNNKIISFPQSIDFKSRKSLNKSIKVYSKHKNLHIFAREPQSYKIMKESFNKNNVYLTPDIVLFLNKIEPNLQRDGIILCLRNDREKKISNNQTNGLALSIKSRYQKVIYYDTYIDHFSKELAKKELDTIWDAFKKAKVVVTDRLHGMIFCAITKTPCVVLPNSNHKIESTYNKWLANVNYIIFVENFDEKIILEHIETLYNLKNDDENISFDLSDKYGSLLEALKIN
ncbi:polysaccharide pyruvyl transferase family protein [Neobacillus drentensis]|uniref:polysaccharide pyruvyl transferase family protein n=1 Tax=Neobacillus drentensis TaxID=220684 RepID=UPI003000C7D6